MRNIYLILCILGFILPYSQLVPFLLANSLDLNLFFQKLFANQISSCFAIDFIITSLVFWTFVFWEGSRLKIRYLWVYVVANLTIGLSFALPLFLLIRFRKIEENNSIKSPQIS